MATDCIVIYQSKYGATRRYAQWLAEALGCTCVEKAACKPGDLQNYGAIVYGGGIYASGIAGFSLIKKQEEALKGKRLVVFAVGASPEDEAIVPALRTRNLPQTMQDTPLFYLRGAFDEEKMTRGDRLLIGMLKRMLQKKDPAKLEHWEHALLDSIGQSADWTHPQAIQPVLAAVRG